MRFDGNADAAGRQHGLAALRARMQMVYQDPLGALDRRLPVGAQICEPLAIHGIGDAGRARERAAALCARSACSAHQVDRYPHELPAASASASCWRAR